MLELLAFVTQPSIYHFVAYFKNKNESYIDSVNNWYKLDDLKGYFEKIYSAGFSINNKRDTEPLVLFVYLKTN